MATAFTAGFPAVPAIPYAQQQTRQDVIRPFSRAREQVNSAASSFLHSLCVIA